MSINKNSIHILRGTKTKPNVNSTILYDGQLYFDRGTKTLQVGDKSNSTIGNNNNYVTVKDGAINDAKVASNAAIKGSKLADANNTSSPSGITTSKIENSAITTSKLANANGNTSNPSGITTDKIENGAITTSKIRSGAVNDDKVAIDANINGSKLQDESITGDKILYDTVIAVRSLQVGYHGASDTPYEGQVLADKGIICGDFLHLFDTYNEAQYTSTYIYYHNTEKQQGKLLFPKRNLAADGEVIATLNNLPKFQAIDGNLYITT